jgi:hypothetical protein
LQSPQLSNLLIKCPNARANIGKNRNHFVPNPSAVSPTELAAFEFIGRLCGLAMRSGNLLNLDFPVRLPLFVVWEGSLASLIVRSLKLRSVFVCCSQLCGSNWLDCL